MIKYFLLHKKVLFINVNRHVITTPNIHFQKVNDENVEKLVILFVTNLTAKIKENILMESIN